MGRGSRSVGQIGGVSKMALVRTLSKSSARGPKINSSIPPFRTAPVPASLLRVATRRQRDDYLLDWPRPWSVVRTGSGRAWRTMVATLDAAQRGWRREQCLSPTV
ncbi:hypothetical protein NDU88_008623 [Pleurodeles waltl]|uniref:Uncharacterized protein n=1 Tax=Pleurodeles waltl TaxID=8319 RepID=A0AAV7QP42_PLEWA|nr:hypothetical protein NDU88_008623 [Pleurodeles waltl]